MAESRLTSCSVLVQCLALLAGLLRRCVLHKEKSVSTECQSDQYTQRTPGAADGARVPRRCPRKLPLGSTDFISAFHWSTCGTHSCTGRVQCLKAANRAGKRLYAAHRTFLYTQLSAPFTNRLTDYTALQARSKAWSCQWGCGGTASCI